MRVDPSIIQPILSLMKYARASCFETLGALPWRLPSSLSHATFGVAGCSGKRRAGPAVGDAERDVDHDRAPAAARWSITYKFVVRQ